MLSEQKMLDEALKIHEEALEIQKGVGGPRSIANTYNFIAHVLTLQRKFDKAIDYHSEALQILLGRFGKYDPDVIGTYGDFGYVYMEFATALIHIEPEQSNAYFEKALDYLEKTIESSIHVCGEKSELTARSYAHIGGTYFHYAELQDILNGNSCYLFGQALEYFQMALNIYLDLFGEYDTHTADTYRSLGGCYGRLDMTDEAFESLRKADNIKKQLVVMTDEGFESTHKANNIKKQLEKESVKENKKESENADKKKSFIWKLLGHKK